MNVIQEIEREQISAVTAKRGVPEFGPGDTFVCEPGLRGTWEVTSALRKAFVIRRI